MKFFKVWPGVSLLSVVAGLVGPLGVAHAQAPEPPPAPPFSLSDDAANDVDFDDEDPADMPPKVFERMRAASRAQYAQRLETFHKTKTSRKEEHVAEVAIRYRRVRDPQAFVDELRTHAERMARLRRMGSLVMAELRDDETQQRVVTLILVETKRHMTTLEAFEVSGSGHPQ